MAAYLSLPSDPETSQAEARFSQEPGPTLEVPRVLRLVRRRGVNDDQDRIAARRAGVAPASRNRR